MTFLSPGALVWALWAAPILLFYAWRVRSPRYHVSTGQLWAQVFSSPRPRSRWRRWRHPVSLAVQLLILLTLVAALAQPCWRMSAPAVSSAEGGDEDNLGITRLAARRDSIDPARCQVLVEVASQTTQEDRHVSQAGTARQTSQSPPITRLPAQCRIEFELDGQQIDVADIQLTPGKRWTEVYQLTSRDGGRLTARLDRPDGRLADNSAALLLPPSGMRRVVLVDREKGSLRRALESNPRVELTVADAPPASLDAGALLVLNGSNVDRIPDGPTLIVDPPGSCSWWELGELLPDAVVARQDEGSPLMANVSLVGLRLAGARRLTLTERARPLGRAIAWTADGSPLAYEIAREGGSLVVLSGNVESGDLGSRAALPILMANVVARLGRDGTRQAAEVHRSDELSPVVQAENVPPAGSADFRPSDVGPNRGAGNISAAPVEVPLWHYFVGAAFLMLVMEWILYQRRWIC